ncbi:hypothetical protein GCM10028808_57710 [Spirosoma migulaei]
MRNQPRDVTGAEELANMVPGYGFIMYILNVLTVPIEVFFRWNFGERYFTRANFIGGIGILILWELAAKVMGMFSMFNPLAFLLNNRGSTESAMPDVLKWYVYFSLFHFATMWWVDVIGRPKHSFWPGNSFFIWIGKGVMWVLNIFLGLFVRLIFFVFRMDKSRLKVILPVLYDADTFTQRFIEPFFIALWAIFCMAIGQYAMAWWLIFSLMAHITYTGLRHESERGLFLDYRDQMIEARSYSTFLEVGSKSPKRPANTQERMMLETTREVEKNPDVLPVIEERNPSLAKALEKISPRLKTIALKEQGPNDTVQAA